MILYNSNIETNPKEFDKGLAHKLVMNWKKFVSLMKQLVDTVMIISICPYKDAF